MEWSRCSLTLGNPPIVFFIDEPVAEIVFAFDVPTRPKGTTVSYQQFIHAVFVGGQRNDNTMVHDVAGMFAIYPFGMAGERRRREEQNTYGNKPENLFLCHCVFLWVYPQAGEPNGPNMNAVMLG